MNQFYEKNGKIIRNHFNQNNQLKNYKNHHEKLKLEKVNLPITYFSPEANSYVSFTTQNLEKYPCTEKNY